MRRARCAGGVHTRLAIRPRRRRQQAAWRTDPAQAGASFIVGDLGTQCFHLSEFVTGRRTAVLAADLQIMVPGRRLEDNAISSYASTMLRVARHVGFCGCGRRAGRAAAPRL